MDDERSVIKTIVVIRSFARGGAENNALMLAKYLREVHHHDVEVWAVLQGGGLDSAFNEFSIPTRVLNLKWSGKFTKLKTLVTFWAAVVKARPDTILGYTILPNTLCGAVWRFTKTGRFVWRQGDLGEGVAPGKLECFAAKSTPAFIAACPSAKNFLVSKCMVPGENVRVIFKGVEPFAGSVEDRVAYRRKRSIPAEGFACGMIGNLRSGKDHETLIRAWSIVLGQVEDAGKAVLLLAGRDDGEMARLKALAFDLGISAGAIRFLGEVEEIPEFVSAIDLCVFSGRAETEACPYGITECMAAGKAVVASDIPGIRDAVGTHQFDMLSAPFSSTEMAEHILVMLSDPEHRNRLGALNRDRVLSEFTVSGMLDRTVSLIERGRG